MIISVIYNLTRIQEIFQIYNSKLIENSNENLAQYNVSLDSDPVSMGLSSLNEKIAKIQLQKDYLLQKFFTIINLKNESENLLTETEQFVSIIKSEAITPEIADMKNQALRDAALVKQLKSEYEMLSQVTQLVNECKNLYIKFQLQVSNLESTNQNLKKQLDVIGYQLQINEITRR